MTSLGYDAATVAVLWRRDLVRFFRQPSRLAGALGQPIIFWLVIGSGMAATFRMPGSPVGYLQFFYPGVVLMVVLAYRTSRRNVDQASRREDIVLISTTIPLLIPALLWPHYLSFLFVPIAE